MTDTAVHADQTSAEHPSHPLDPATAAEYLAGRNFMAAAGLLAEPVRFAYYGLEEPPKHDVLSGLPTDRRLRAFLVNTDTGESTDVVVSLMHRDVVRARRLDPARDGQMPILDSDFALVDEITKADPQWRAAMAGRGYHDVSRIRTCPITAGNYGPSDDDRRRMVRVLAFVQDSEHGLAWAHPIDGVAAYVDLIEKKVFKVTDEFELPVPTENGDYDHEEVRGPHRTTLKPIEITQPEGPSFTLDGHALRWQGWSLRIGFDAREGLTLHQVSNAGRPVIYRASIPEMVVPYGDPNFRYWQAYFDSGEYLVGKWANSLELGCDCLGEIAYLDATVTDDTGHPRTIPNAICIHEEDFSILWKHTDIFNGSAQSRRQRRLVVSYFTTVGNYDYGFYWYFYLDGTIECEIKATGVLFTSAHPGGGGSGGRPPRASRASIRTPPRSRRAWPRPITSICSAPAWT
jgi:primary-amine oxidase